MMTVENHEVKLITTVRQALGAGVHTYKSRGKWRVQVGTSIPNSEYPVATPVYLTHKKTGGKNVSVAKTWSAFVYSGFYTSGQPRQIPLSQQTHTLVNWTTEYLALAMWTVADNTKQVGLTNNKARVEAWKRWLLRFWAAYFPNALLITGDMEDGDSDTPMKAPSKRETRARKNQDLEDLAKDQEEAIREGEDDTGVAEQQLDQEHGIVDFSDWWEKFNVTPWLFDLDNSKVYHNVARSFMAGTHGDFNDEQIPPLDVLKTAASISEISRGRKKVEKVQCFISWRTGCTLNLKDECGYRSMPSLDNLKVQGSTMAKDEKADRARLESSRWASSLWKDIERRWKLTPEQSKEITARLPKGRKSSDEELWGSCAASRWKDMLAE